MSWNGHCVVRCVFVGLLCTQDEEQSFKSFEEIHIYKRGLEKAGLYRDAAIKTNVFI